MRQLAVAVAACCYGINAIVTKYMVGHERIGLATAVVALAALMMLPFSWWDDGVMFSQATPLSLGAMVTLGVLQTAVATMLMFAVIGRQGASFFSQLNFLVPLFGVAFGFLFLGEEVTLSAAAALALIMVGIAVARRGIGLTRKADAG